MFQIKIPNPCHENWEKMTPTQKGAFCKVCSKEVLDFTHSSQSKIKDSLLEEKDPCVRILQSQMDDMNFQEWFRSLNLRKKIKYVFLFSFIIAYQNLSAQDIVQPQIVLLDSTDTKHIDSSALADITNNVNHSTDPICTVSPSLDGLVSLSGMMDYPVGGAVSTIDIASIYGGMVISIPDANPLDTYEIDFQDQIVIEDEIFSFTTEDDSLYFKSVLPAAALIFLSIEQDRLGKAPYPPYNEVFESPLQLEKGEHIIKIPISQYANGSYTIKIKSKKGEGIGRIIYW